jgi:hypothetical protein
MELPDQLSDQINIINLTLIEYEPITENNNENFDTIFPEIIIPEIIYITHIQEPLIVSSNIFVTNNDIIKVIAS